MDRLPRGVFFEPRRNRYRVRLYYCQDVVWRSYHPCLETALEELYKARRHRLQYVRGLGSVPPKCLPKHLKDLLQ
jgi:hypothetical protein